MRFDQMAPSKYLKKSDFPEPALLTVHSFQQENVAREDEPEELKWVVYFNEISDKGLVLNSTNLQLLQMATGVEDTDQSIGMKVVVYTDPSITMMGKVVGGLRIRAPKIPVPRSAPAAPASPFPSPAVPHVVRQHPHVAQPPATSSAGPGPEEDDVPF